MVFYLNQASIRSRLGQSENRSMIEPGMTSNNSVGLTWPEQNGWQRIHKFNQSLKVRRINPRV